MRLFLDSLLIQNSQVGCHIYQEHRADPSLIHLQEINRSLACECLENMREENDPFTFAQAHHFMAIACLYNHGLIRAGTFHHKRAVEAIKRNNIRFVPSQQGLPCTRAAFSEEVHERAVFLAQVVYSEINKRFLAGDPEDPELDLEKQFRYELPVRKHPLLLLC